MKQILLIIVLCLLNCINSQGSNLYTLALFSKERGASCLDGSPAGIYYHRGSGTNINKYLIYFQEGGYCNGLTIAQTLEDCYKRSKTNYGSTSKRNPTISYDNNGLLSPLQSNNPVFHDWTKVFVFYCDGSVHSGTRQDPISYKDTQLFFRGHNNTMQLFDYMDKQFDFYNGDTIVITGVSAGGVATFLYANYLLQNTKTAKVLAIPDSGLFVTEFYSPLVGYQPIRERGTSLYNLIQEEGFGFPIPECIEEFDNEYYHCYNGANLAKYIKTPIFVVESTYDQYCIDNIVATLCKANRVPPYSLQNCNQTERKVIQDYRSSAIDALKKIKGDRNDVGWWSPACVQHGFSHRSSFTDSRFQIPSANGPILTKALQQFLDNPQSAQTYLDQVPWPYNTGCNGLSNLQIHSQ